jgi:hypothetical protein
MQFPVGTGGHVRRRILRNPAAARPRRPTRQPGLPPRGGGKGNESRADTGYFIGTSVLPCPAARAGVAKGMAELLGPLDWTPGRPPKISATRLERPVSFPKSVGRRGLVQVPATGRPALPGGQSQPSLTGG